MRGAGTEMPALCSTVPSGASPWSRKAGVPGCRPRPKTWRAVSQVRVRGEHTTRSKAVKDLPPDGLVLRMSLRESAWAIPTGVRRES